MSAGLHARVQAAIAAGQWDEQRFDDLARALFAHQCAGTAYGRYCAGRGVSAEQWPGWRAVPPVPTDVFKAVDLCTFDVAEAAVTFLTSGTTVGTRGRHHLRRTDTYEASIAPPFDRFLRPGGDPIFVLAPDAPEAPESSLSYMLRWAVDHRGGEGSCFFWDEGPDVQGFVEAVGALSSPALLLGTARAWLAVLDAGELSLPEGSRLMETGGFKGASVDESPGAFRARLAAGFGLPRHAVVSEYGMTELGSQGYQPGLARAQGDGDLDDCGADCFVFPPWCRVVTVEPDSLQVLPEGERGLLCFHDLSNVDSVCAVQTADVGIVRGHAVELFGRAAGATPRGCSIAVDEILRGLGQ